MDYIKLYHLPNELILYIHTYIPINFCNYCNNSIISFKKHNIYCSVICEFYHNLIILNRLSKILILYLFINIKLFLIRIFYLYKNSLNIFIFLCISYYLYYITIYLKIILSYSLTHSTSLSF